MRCRVADNEMMTSFSNPNYGLDALNSNCLLSSPSNSDVIVDNVTVNINLLLYSYLTSGYQNVSLI